jgi:hypothetical protein
MKKANPSTVRVEKLREGREQAGIKRREVCAHDDDWPEIKALAVRRLRRREKMAAGGK